MNRLLRYLNRYYYCLNKELSPTFHNIALSLHQQGWRHTPFKWRALFSDENFEFDSAAAMQLEYKHLLAELVTNYCPKVMPPTYCIDDSNWPAILSLLSENENRDTKVFRANPIWILKPSLLNNGQHIKIFQSLNQIERHYLSSNRLGGPHVLQHYLTEPHLLKGHKYSIRMFVIMTNYAGIKLYPNGYINVALKSYQSEDYSELACHLTNEHLQEYESNVIQIPSERLENFQPLYNQIKQIITSTTSALHIQFPQAFVCEKKPALAIFGFDFMVDINKKVWLLEANHGPCFPIDRAHALQSYLYDDFWKAIRDEFVLPITMGNSMNTQRSCFESIEYNYPYREASSHGCVV